MLETGQLEASPCRQLSERVKPCPGPNGASRANSCTEGFIYGSLAADHPAEIAISGYGVVLTKPAASPPKSVLLAVPGDELAQIGIFTEDPRMGIQLARYP